MIPHILIVLLVYGAMMGLVFIGYQLGKRL